MRFLFVDTVFEIENEKKEGGFNLPLNGRILLKRESGQ
jgi:hypothetical protein